MALMGWQPSFLLKSFHLILSANLLIMQAWPEYSLCEHSLDMESEHSTAIVHPVRLHYPSNGDLLSIWLKNREKVNKSKAI